MSYSYAFGDHTLFLRNHMGSYPSLWRAFEWSDGQPFLHVYEGAEMYLALDLCKGGDLVAVIEFNETFCKLFYKNYMPGTPMRRADMDFNLMERYIRRLIHRRAKEQV